MSSKTKITPQVDFDVGKFLKINLLYSDFKNKKPSFQPKITWTKQLITLSKFSNIKHRVWKFSNQTSKNYTFKTFNLK